MTRFAHCAARVGLVVPRVDSCGPSYAPLQPAAAVAVHRHTLAGKALVYVVMTVLQTLDTHPLKFVAHGSREWVALTRSATSGMLRAQYPRS